MTANLQCELIMIAGADRPHPWISEALASAGDYPVRVIDRCLPGGLGAARAMAIESSRADYIAWLDSDDRVISSAIPMLLGAIGPGDVGAFGNEISINAQGQQIGAGATSGAEPWQPLRMIHDVPYGRHLAIFRRDAALPFLDQLAQAQHGLEVWVLRCLLASAGNWVHVAADSYQHRKHGDNTGKLGAAGYARHAVELSPLLVRANRRINAKPTANLQSKPACPTCSKVRAALGPVGRVLDRLIPI